MMYTYKNGKRMSFDSIISNQFYGLEEQIMGNLGPLEPEVGKYYFEKTPPMPGFLQMINNIEKDIFSSVSFAGPSWDPEIARKNHGEYIIGKKRDFLDGTGFTVDAFVEAAITADDRRGGLLRDRAVAARAASHRRKTGNSVPGRVPHRLSVTAKATNYERYRNQGAANPPGNNRMDLLRSRADGMERLCHRPVRNQLERTSVVVVRNLAVVRAALRRADPDPLGRQARPATRVRERRLPQT